MRTVEVVKRERITSEQIDDMLTDAFEGGMTAQWCDELSIAKDPAFLNDSIDYMQQVIALGGVLELHEEGEDKWHRLDLDDVLTSLSKVDFDFDNYDAVDADTVVQTAIFGEVVYG